MVDCAVHAVDNPGGCVGVTPAQRDYLKILIGAMNLAIAVLIFVEVYG